MEIYEKLKAPFPADKISWRIGATSKDKTKGIPLAYIDARDVMNRLDEVFEMNWQCKYSHASTKTVCEISVLIDDVWITRAGGAGDTDIEAEKGALSDAFKRAAVLFGIGRYLYDLPNEWIEIDEYKKFKRKPSLPAWALPKEIGLTDEAMDEALKVMGVQSSLPNLKNAYELYYHKANDEQKIVIAKRKDEIKSLIATLSKE